MTERARSRWPWLVWAVAMVLLAATLTLSVLNGLGEEVEFLPLATAMVIGYSTVGALLASRGTPGTRSGC